jgi:hypothetical protein
MTALIAVLALALEANLALGRATRLNKSTFQAMA